MDIEIKMLVHSHKNSKYLEINIKYNTVPSHKVLKVSQNVSVTLAYHFDVSSQHNKENMSPTYASVYNKLHPSASVQSIANNKGYHTHQH